MGNWSTKSVNEKKYVIFEENDISRQFNSVAFGMLMNNNISCLVPCSVSQTDNTRIVSYNVSGYQNFQEYLDKETSFDFFYSLFMDLCTSLLQLRRYMLDTCSLILDFDKMYIDASAAKIKLLTDPLWKEGGNDDLRTFFRNIIVNLKLGKNDTQRIGIILSMLNKKDFSIDAFWKDLKDINNISASEESEAETHCDNKPSYDFSSQESFTHSSLPQSPVSVQPYIPDEPQPVSDKNTKSGGWLNKLFTKKKASESKNDKISSSMDGLAIPGQDNSSTGSAAVPSFADRGSDVTVIEGDDDMTEVLCESKPIPKLINKASHSAVAVDKNVFRIGRDPNGNDFVISTKLVSHHHAIIKAKKDLYYIIDDNSTNHVFVNGKVIPVNSEVRLKSGDIIKIGSEEFIFEI